MISVIQSIPPGKVMTYGQIAAIAGNPRSARQVARILHSSSRKYSLPWHRIVNSQGKISFSDPNAYNEQKLRLLEEGIRFGPQDCIDLNAYLYRAYETEG